MKKDIASLAKTSFWLYAGPPIVIITFIGIFLIIKQRYVIGLIILIVGLGYFFLRYKKIQQWIKNK